MENQSDKTQDATPFKLQEARNKGQVAKSIEFVSISGLIVMLTVLIFLLPAFASELAKNLAYWFQSSSRMAHSETLVIAYAGQFVRGIAWPVVVVLITGAISAVLLNVLHAGPVFSLFPLKMDLSRLNPANGFKRVFSLRGLFDTIKVILKLVFIGLAAYFVWGQIKDLVLYNKVLSMSLLMENWRKAFTILVVSFLAIFFVFALIDLWFSKRDFAKRMRMSTRDIKDEHKRREGDPEIKQKRKRNMMQLMKSAMSASSVKNADVIIINPTHFAVALQFRANKMPLPRLLTKGRGLVAKIIIKRAQRYNIPIVCRPPLARRLYKNTALDSYIPVVEQVAVAEIYREIIKLPGCRVFS